MNKIRLCIEILVGLAALFLGYKYVKQTRELEQFTQDRCQVASQIQKEAKEIERKVNDKGIETVIFDVTGHTAPLPVLSSNASTKGIIDTTAMALDIRTKQLKEILNINSTLAAENLKLKSMVDINNRPYYTYSGHGLDLKFTPPNDTDSVGSADFTANVKIKAVQYWKRSWFLGAKKSILAVTSDNPMFKINGSDFVEIEQEQPSFGLRLQARIAISPITGMIGYGPAARVDIGRFSLQGNYMYYPGTSTWRPSIIGTYDVIRF